MSYSFYTGASGAGKSSELHKKVIEYTSGSLGRYAMYIVPEQYTMQTQKELVLASPNHGIMNVDVLSFGRLAHRVFAEVGTDDRTPLDDVGKSLILRKAAAGCSKDLSVLKGQMDKLGMISEIKSVISEFMQYGIGVSDVDDLIRYAREHGQGALAARLQDVRLLYQAFLAYEKERFITNEETMDRLAQAIPQSRLIPPSILIFDGFTGFTPVQYRVLAALMQRAKKVIFSLTIGEDGGPSAAECENPHVLLDEQDLFYLPRKTIRDITMLAEKAGVPHDKDVTFGEGTPGRFYGSAAFAHLEKSLFRFPLKPYEPEEDSRRAAAGAALSGSARPAGTAAGRRPPDLQREEVPIEIMQADSVSEEVRQVCIRIRELVRSEGYAFRDFGIVAGDLATYADELELQAARYDIPLYVDRTRAVIQNPLTEAVRSVLLVISESFAYSAVFRYLRSGLSNLLPEETDRLGNYCLARGIRSKGKWMEPFEGDFEILRRKFLYELEPLISADKSAAARTGALYEFLLRIHAAEKMQALASKFEKEGDPVREKEYDQIYRALIALLDQMYELLGDEPVSAADYTELVDAGLQEIKLGTLPQKADRVLAGDIERTRLSEVKVLFFIGANDGSIPRATSKGGLISDLDREFLQESGLELAPTPRQQMYIQRYYLYLNLTKQTARLIVSFAAAAPDGSALRPSYLIDLLRRMFPAVKVRTPQLRPMEQQLVSDKDSVHFLAAGLRDFADGLYDRKPEEKDRFLTVYGLCCGAGRPQAAAVRRLSETAFARYTPMRLSAETAALVYGDIIRGSVTRLETAAQCYLKQYLQYGLQLRRRGNYTFEPADSGTILHGSIESFGRKLREHHLSWKEFSKEEGRTLIREALSETADQYNHGLVYASARDAYRLGRMEKILERTIETLQYQLRQGEFVPAYFEVDFGYGSAMNFRLSDGRSLSLTGRIDRVDLCGDEGNLYVKIIDYKSGNPDLNKDKMAAGLQLQLLLYMDAEKELLEKLHPGRNVIPAALLYYHFGDPLIRSETLLPDDPCVDENTAEQLREAHIHAIRKSLCPKGMVNADPSVIHLLDRSEEADSAVIPVRLTKKAPQQVAKTSAARTFDEAEFNAMTEAMKRRILELALQIMEGNIQADPVALEGGRSACTFCDYQDVCGFDRKLPGCRYYQVFEKIPKEDREQ